MKRFLERFAEFSGAPATAAAQAPGRLEVLGNHTDYNEGLVLSCAVEQTTCFALRPVPGSRCRVRDLRDGTVMQFDLADREKIPSDGSRYVLGMVRELEKRGGRIGAFDAALESSVPLSAGMSSSAALEISAGLALCRAFGLELAPEELARAGQGVENDFLGLRTGLLDQFSSVFGRKNAMIESDFRTVRVARLVPVPQGYSFVVIHSMKKHDLVDSAYNERRADCERAAAGLARLYPGKTALRDVEPEELLAVRGRLPEREFRRARHVVEECFRVREAVRLLGKGDAAGFGKLLFDSHESSRVNFENSTPELDYLVELARSVPGCLGARLSGGGFGGISIHFVETAKAEEYTRRVCAAYRQQTGIAPQSFLCAIGDGASVFPL